MSENRDLARLIVSCRGRHGIVAALSTCLAEAGANIVGSDQFSTDPEGGSRASHEASTEELEWIGRDVERTVLGRAVRWHLDDRVFVDGRRTIAF